MENIKYKSERLFLRVGKDIRFWRIEVIEQKDMFNTAKVSRFYGVLNKFEIPNSYVVDEGKNIGKRNATTPVTQAIAEAKAQVKDKLNNGYRSLKSAELDMGAYTDEELATLLFDILPDDILDIENKRKPMKAIPYKADTMEYPAIVQPKINGVRTFASIGKPSFKHSLFDEESPYILNSKEGHVYDVAHISLALNELIDKSNSVALEDYFPLKKEDLVFDGELYIPFEKSTSIKGATSRDNALHKKLIFIIFDLAIPDLSQLDRLQILSKLFGKSTQIELINSKHAPMICLLPSTLINYDGDAIDKAFDFINLGFEGAIVRDINATYQFGKRRMNMMKVKNCINGYFEIVDIIPQTKHANLGVAICKNDDGSESTFKCSFKDTTKQKEYYLANKEKYIGSIVPITYFERTINNLPFHGIITKMPEL